MKTIQVLYISYDGMTDPLGQSQVIPYLEKLSECGYCFTILSFEKKEIYHKRKQAILKILSAHQIEWVPMIYHKSPPVLSTVYDVFKMRKKALELHRDKKFSILHCRSYLSALVGLYFQKTGKARFVFDMRGFWADERVDGKIWSLKNPVLSSVYHYFKRKEKEFFNSADAVISLTENAKE